MVHDAVWQAAGMPTDRLQGAGRGFLCIGCLEGRLGRKLVARDFTSARSTIRMIPGRRNGLPIACGAVAFRAAAGKLAVQPHQSTGPGLCAGAFSLARSLSAARWCAEMRRAG